MRKWLAMGVTLCGAALLAAPGVVAQTDASVVVTPGRTRAFIPPDRTDARMVITPGPAETLVNPESRGRPRPAQRREGPRFVSPDEAASRTSVHPGSRPLVVYPDTGGPGGIAVSPGRRPVVVYPP